ncbi:hypothetical protein [Nocardioides cynanchi]|uniref:hypothetical protein n=1 Tax=Nocardioides cynanchi TaxID=2558918 RepID=UPI00124558C3|nr:hypothetical protein [Nocardioides cynanchi]
MSQPSTTPVRPSQVTVASWMIMIGSVFVVLMVWDRIAGLHSLESRQALQSVLDNPGVKGSGLQVDDLMLVVRILGMVAAGCATAMVVLGYQAMHRSRVARLVMSILAVPLFVGGLAIGGFVSSGVAAAVATLWLGPARAWFDGRDPAADRPRPLPRQVADPGRPPGGHPSAFGSPTAPTSPTAAAAPPSTPASASEIWAPPRTSVYDARGAAGFGAAPAPRELEGSRPSTVLWACVITWIFAGLTALTLVVSVSFLAANSTAVLAKMHDQNPALAEQGLSDHAILVICYVFCGLCILWCLVAAGCATLVFRRVRWSWLALVVSTSGVAALCLLGVVGSVITLVPLAAAGVTLALLVRPESRRWFG